MNWSLFKENQGESLRGRTEMYKKQRHRNYIIKQNTHWFQDKTIELQDLTMYK